MNTLFPVFLKLEQLHVLIVGGGYVGLEKLTAVLANSPQTQVTLIAPEIREEINELAASHPSVELIYDRYEPHFLEGRDIVIVGTNDKAVNHQVQQD